MKLFIAAFLCLAVFSATAQTTNDYQVTLNGIGAIKIDMSKAELERLLNQKITVPEKKDSDDGTFDTVKVSYKNCHLDVVIYSKYLDDNSTQLAVYAVTGSSSLLKTKSGIIIGDDKIKVINTYPDYYMEVYPAYDPDANGDYKPSKTKSVIAIHSSTGNTVLTFTLENNKVTSFTVSLFEGC
ncbi:MAG: hypothetical protein JSU05_00020 [Bacteroidetes bacterium]|nr:hypothetical protein [Bacteroidota bacterium]